jgi:MraZ protein
MPAKAFIATYTVTLDSKGRVCVPAPYRQLLTSKNTEGVYVCPSFRGEVLECFGDDVLEKETAKLNAFDPFSEAYDGRAALVVMRSQCLPFDDNGRIRLPDPFIAHAHLTDKAVFAGAAEKFFIWEPSRYDVFLAKVLEKAAEPAPGAAS